MRRFVQIVMTAQLVALMGCAAKTAPPPKIEGRVGSVSQRDIQAAIAQVEQYMRHEFWIVYPIDRVDVRDHNEIWLVYRHGPYEQTTVAQRAHGIWSVPPEHVVIR